MTGEKAEPIFTEKRWDLNLHWGEGAFGCGVAIGEGP